jgi:hypothetical protein
MALFLEPFKAVAAEGAVVELKLRLLAGKVPALQKYAHKKELGEIETDLVKHFDGSLSAQEKETLRLCRQLRNKVPHSDFRAARGKLNELGVETQSGGVVKRRSCSTLTVALTEEEKSTLTHCRQLRVEPFMFSGRYS